MASIRIKRVPSLTFKRRPFAIRLNGKPIGDLQEGEERIFTVEPGSHTIDTYLRHFGGSKVLEFYLDETSELFFEIKSNPDSQKAPRKGILSPRKLLIEMLLIFLATQIYVQIAVKMGITHTILYIVVGFLIMMTGWDYWRFKTNKLPPNVEVLFIGTISPEKKSSD